MKKGMLIGIGVAAALAAGVGAYSYSAFAQGGPGWGPGWMMMGDGSGPGFHMRGMGPGPGAGPWNCPGFAANDGQGYGPGNRMGGPGWMMGRGYGPGYDRRGDTVNNQPLNLTTADVKGRMERWLSWNGNPRLQVGEVKEKDADTITADIVTKDNSLVQRFVVDRHTGFTRRDSN